MTEEEAVMTSTIIITGGAGFLGSNLADVLIDRDYSVVIYDNLSMGKIQNIEHQIRKPNVSFVKGDVRDIELLRSACSGAEVIVHLAAYKIPRYGNSLDTLMINSGGMHNVLEVARSNGARVVVASTSDVYGKNLRVPFNEESDLTYGSSTVRRWSYAVSKLFDEHLCLAYHETHGVPVAILRLFGSYGPRQHVSWWGGPQAVFIDAILRGEPVEIHGDGSQTRSFTYVSDTVAGVLAAIESGRVDGQILNIGSEREISILALARLIKSLSGSPGDLDYRLVPYSTFGKYEDVPRRVPDVEKARRILGFEAQVSLEEGLTRTIEWQRALTG